MWHKPTPNPQVIGNTQYMLTVGDDPHRVYYNSAKHYTVNELGEQVRVGLATVGNAGCGGTPQCVVVGAVGRWQQQADVR